MGIWACSQKKKGTVLLHGAMAQPFYELLPICHYAYSYIYTAHPAISTKTMKVHFNVHRARRVIPSRQIQNHHLQWQPHPWHPQQRGHHTVGDDDDPKQHPNSHHPAAGALAADAAGASVSFISTASLHNHSYQTFARQNGDETRY
jgi:hypothetical protein